MIGEEMLMAEIKDQPLEAEKQMKIFVQRVAAKDPCALDIMERIEAGEIQPTDAFDALEACISARH